MEENAHETEIRPLGSRVGSTAPSTGSAYGSKRKKIKTSKS
jgi:hypothetical protein